MAPPHGIGAMLDTGGTLQYFDTADSSDAGKIVGRGRGVWRGGNQYTVFHQGDFAAAVTIGAPNADIGAQAVTLLAAAVDAWRLGQDAMNVRIVKFLKFDSTDHAARTRQSFPAGDNGDGLQRFAGLLPGSTQGRPGQAYHQCGYPHPFHFPFPSRY